MTIGIGCSPITGVIYAGNIRKHKDGVKEYTGQWTDVTDEAITAVIAFFNVKFRQSFKDGDGELGLSGTFKNGRKYKLTYTEIKDGKE